MDIDIQVENIKCIGCANTISTSLLKLEGVHEVVVNIIDGFVQVKVDESLDRDMLVSKLKFMGYPEPGKGSGITKATSYISCMIGRVSS